MADKYSAANLGYAVQEWKVIKGKCASPVTKGQVVAASASVTDDYPTVEPQAAGTFTTSIGVALESGSTGDVIPILVSGIVKVKAGSGGCTVGLTVGATPANSEPGTVGDKATAGQIIGKALHTMSSGDTGLILLNVGGG